ncbi:MAG: MarR family EPS-associated transcriptional regulator [Campylobacterales bacterium]|nr:MarR family EPS-associated transcriptional regulator [Campylobacterales bacterium]
MIWAVYRLRYIIHSLNEQGIAHLKNTDPFDVLHVLQNVEAHHSQQSLADEVGYSVGKVNYILKALIAKGLVKMENFVKSENKKGYRYLLTGEGIREKIALTEAYIKIKKSEYEALQRSLQEDQERIKKEGLL